MSPAPMSHQAIARKFRPQVFEDIIGQQHVTRTLQNAIRLARVHHAFLLTGARGVGKTSAARVLSRALNCESGPAENPCNECPSCTEMLVGSFPDVIEFDAASHNSVDDIRDLVDKVRYAPQRGRYKIYIIDEVHMVTKQGFNALLKTLEEPPPHVIFILATTDPQQLLDTVISRCQRFDFKMIPVRTTYEHLKFVAQAEGVEVPDASLMTIAREGGGSMRDAQSLLDQVLSFAGESVTEAEVAEILGFIDRSILYDVLEGALAGDPAAALEAVAKVSLFGFDVRTFANQLLEAVRNVTVVRQVRDAPTLLDLPDNEIARLQTLAQGRDMPQLMQQFDILAQAVDGIARSEQPALLLDMAAVKMASVRPYVPVEALVERLLRLEKRLAAGGAVPRRGGPGGGSPPFPPEGSATEAHSPPPPAAAAAIPSPASAPPSAPEEPGPAPREARPEPGPARQEAPPEPPRPQARPKSTPPQARPEPPRPQARPKSTPPQARPEPPRPQARPKSTPPQARPEPARPQARTEPGHAERPPRSDDDLPPMPDDDLPPMPDDDFAPPDDEDTHHEAAPPRRPLEERPPAEVPTPKAVLGRLESYRSRSARGGEPKRTQALADAEPAPPVGPATAAKPASVQPADTASAPVEPADAAPPPAEPADAAPAPAEPVMTAPRDAAPAEPVEPQPAPPNKPPSTPTRSPALSRRDPARPDPGGTDLCDAVGWRRFVHALPREEGMGPVKAALATAGFLSAIDGVIHVGFEGTIGLNQARNLSSHPTLEEALAQAFGEGSRLAFSLDADGHSGRTLNEEVDRIRAERRAALDQNARSHPTVQLTLAQFDGARIDGVRLPEVKEVTDVQ